MNNLISIIIPAYNVEKYIGECLQSIQQQTFKKWQAIIVEDGSTDKTAEIAQAITEQDNRFRLIKQPNTGVSAARNTGMQAATGKYVAFLDGDDMWAPTFLAELLAAIETQNVGMAYCGYTHLYASGLRRKFSYPYASGDVLLEVVQGKTQIHIGATLVKKETLDQAGLEFTVGCLVGQDQEFIWKLVSLVKVQAVPQELMIYRIRSGSAVTAKWNWQKHIHAWYGFKRAADYVMQQRSQAYDYQQLSKALHERVAYKLYKFIWRMIKNGYHEDARQLLKSEECSKCIACLNPEQLSLVDKVKYRLVSSPQEIGWQVARFF